MMRQPQGRKSWQWENPPRTLTVGTAPLDQQEALNRRAAEKTESSKAAPDEVCLSLRLQ
jgi:hypothetical protein